MAFNKAASYRQMVGFLEQAGYDVPVKDMDDSKSDFAFMNRTELLRYASVLEATYEARTDNMDANAILDEISEINARLAGHERLGIGNSALDAAKGIGSEAVDAVTESQESSPPQQQQQKKPKKPNNLLENISNDLASNPAAMNKGVQNALRAAAGMNPPTRAQDTMPAMPKMPAGKVAPNTAPAAGFGIGAELGGAIQSMLPGGMPSSQTEFSPQALKGMQRAMNRAIKAKKYQLSTMPDCDFCGKEAQYDGTTVHGPSAYMCKSCLPKHGKGEPTELTTDKIDMPECDEPEIHQLIDEEGGDCPGCGMSSDGGGWF